MTKQHSHTCGIAAMMNIFGDRWTWLLVREAFYGASRFTEFQRNTGASRNILTDRLQHLVTNGIFAVVEIGQSGSRSGYTLTEKGKALLPVMITMGHWANRFEYGAGNEPVVHINKATGAPLDGLQFVDTSGAVIELEDLTAEAGPGAEDTTLRRLARRQDGFL